LWEILFYGVNRWMTSEWQDEHENNNKQISSFSSLKKKKND
jgi:hypothetical protein